MTFSDIMALAKNGYKPSDIKELMALPTEPEQPGANQNEPEQSGANQSGPEQPGANQSGPEQPGANQSGPEQPKDTSNAEMEALKKQVAELSKKLSDTQSELKTAQKANTQSNVKPAGGQSDTERLNDWARSFM